MPFSATKSTIIITAAVVAAAITVPIGYLIGATLAQLPYVASMGNEQAASAGGIKGALVGLVIGVIIGGLVGSQFGPPANTHGARFDRTSRSINGDEPS